MKINLEITVSRLNINQLLKCDTTQLCVDFGRVLGIDGDSYLWELGEDGVLVPKNDKTFTLKKASEVDADAGSNTKFLNERGDFTAIEIPTPINSHTDLTDKNAEANYQHVDTTTTKGTLVSNDKVAIFDSVTGAMVLTNKANVGGGSTTPTLLTSVNNGSTVSVIRADYNWHRQLLTGGGYTLTLDFANSGVLPISNFEHILILKSERPLAVTVTLPSVSFEKGGITYTFASSVGSFPLATSKSVEINILFVFTTPTTCEIRITTQLFTS